MPRPRAASRKADVLTSTLDLPRPAADGPVREYVDADGAVHPMYQNLMSAAQQLGPQGLRERWRRAKRDVDVNAFSFLLDPKTFRSTPTDWIPRIIHKDEWDRIGAGVEQRLKALNMFLLDLYCGTQTIVPDDVIYSSQFFYPDYQGFRPAKDVFVHVYGIDLVHVGGGSYVILEDNLRIPSGISYQLKAVEISQRLFPEFASAYQVVPYDIAAAYRRMLGSLCDSEDPTCVLLTDGKYGAAFFEHRYLSDLLGIPLVDGSDLYIGVDGRVWVKKLDGDAAVDLIYRRVEDLEIFVPGLTEAYLQRKVILVNGMGTSAADDKLVFLWVPEMIRHYLGEEPILEQAKSYDLIDQETMRYVLGNLDELVLKVRQGYGGLGVYILPDMDPSYRSRLARQIIEEPRGYIAQETIDFSKHVIFDDETKTFEDRYVDLRVFAIQNGHGETQAFPGGLTRVARSDGRITNNSSGGLCKPTWVVR